MDVHTVHSVVALWLQCLTNEHDASSLCDCMRCLPHGPGHLGLIKNKFRMALPDGDCQDLCLSCEKSPLERCCKGMRTMVNCFQMSSSAGIELLMHVAITLCRCLHVAAAQCTHCL